MNILKKPAEKFFVWFDGLNNKERHLSIGLFFSIISLLILIVFLWANSNINSRLLLLQTSKKQLNEIVSLESHYRSARRQKLERDRRYRYNNISLFSLMQRVANSLRLSLKDLNEQKVPLPDINLVEYSVVVNLTKLSIDKLTAFLKATEEIQTPGLIKVTKLKVKSRFDNSELLDAQMTVSTWKAS